ncbi:MAG: LysR family transcriptional regulator [Variovorax sp.]|nr:MAG: LysR family transcriptional regulator [Variovorax sp.]
MNRMDDLEAFLAIIEQGSQTAAARHLKRTVQSIARSLTSLESGIGAALIKRTTRQSHPTEAGLAFYARLKPAVAEIDDARAEASDLGRKLAGRLSVGAPALFARAFVVAAVCDFLARFPQVEVDLKATDRPVDLLDEGLDVAVRIRKLPDSSMKARRLGELRLVAFGAKGYLQTHGRPLHPTDLSHHKCIVRTVDGMDEPWAFRIDGRQQAVRVQRRFRTNDTTAIHAAVARGLGIGFAPLWQIQDMIDRGIAEVVLQEFEAERLPIYAVLPPTRTQTMKVRRFVDLLAMQLKGVSL